jgi:hypothetical protein
MSASGLMCNSCAAVLAYGMAVRMHHLRRCVSLPAVVSCSKCPRRAYSIRLSVHIIR